MLEPAWRRRKSIEYSHHLSSSWDSTGMVTSSTLSSSPPRVACTKQRLNGWFSTQSVRSSL